MFRRPSHHPCTISGGRAHRVITTVQSQAVELIEEAHALQPKVSTALSAANLRLKLGHFGKAAAAYRRVLQAAGGEGASAPSEVEAGMARGKLCEAEEGLRRQQAEAMSPIERRGRPRAIAWCAAHRGSRALFHECHLSVYALRTVCAHDVRMRSQVSALTSQRSHESRAFTLPPSGAHP